jgi:hypothetical protein
LDIIWDELRLIGIENGYGTRQGLEVDSASLRCCLQQVRIHKQSQPLIEIKNRPSCLVCVSKPSDRAHPDVRICDRQYIIEETLKRDNGTEIWQSFNANKALIHDVEKRSRLVLQKCQCSSNNLVDCSDEPPAGCQNGNYFGHGREMIMGNWCGRYETGFGGWLVQLDTHIPTATITAPFQMCSERTWKLHRKPFLG